MVVDYTFSAVNQETVPLAYPETMQFGHALPRVLQELVYANPQFGPVHLLKVDVADGFYHIHLNPTDVSTLSVAFPSLANLPRLVAFPLTLPIGWV